ncbi:MAG TPA: hypothetical protein VGF67_06050 [Ktedonobacteraceae bacterium]|jgi:hypothetical protein
MYTGALTNQAQPEVAREYEAALLTWTRRLQSMYLPGHGFSLYPPEEGGKHTPDTYCAPLGVRHLLNLPEAVHSGLTEPAVRALLDEIATMVTDAAACYAITRVPQPLKTCHDAYQAVCHDSAAQTKAEALAFVRSRLRERQGQMLVEVAANQPSYRLWGMAVSQREETAYATATLLHGGHRSHKLSDRPVQRRGASV